jgi:hypothetical protein
VSVSAKDDHIWSVLVTPLLASTRPAATVANGASQVTTAGH